MAFVGRYPCARAHLCQDYIVFTVHCKACMYNTLQLIQRSDDAADVHVEKLFCL